MNLWPTSPRRGKTSQSYLHTGRSWRPCGWLGLRHRLVDPMPLQFSVNGLREAGLPEPNRFRSLDAEKFLQVRRHVTLNHRVMREISQNFRAAAFRDVAGDQHEVQLALVAAQGLAANEQLRDRNTNGNRRSTGLAGAGFFMPDLSPDTVAAEACSSARREGG